MIGEWSTIIKTFYVQFYTIFTISDDAVNGLRIRMDSEPVSKKLIFDQVTIAGNSLQASGTDSDGKKQELELKFNGDTFSGSLTFPYLGAVAFTGKRGKSVSLADRLGEYGEKSVQENRYWKGKWIWDVKQPENDENSQHRLVYFRRTFQVAQGIEPKLIIDITADSRYRLYVNGLSVAVGPCKGDGDVHYFETVDVSSYLVSGKNVLAVKVLSYPYTEPFKRGESGPISIWRSPSAGLLVEASLRDEHDVELESMHSGMAWKTFRHQGYRNVPKPFIQWMGGVEEVEGIGSLQGWEMPYFDDSTWTDAIPFADTRGFSGVLSPWSLAPRPIPFLYEEKRSFVSVTNAEGIPLVDTETLLNNRDGHAINIEAGSKLVVELDAGELTTGYLSVGVRGGRGGIIRLLSSECYEAQDSSTMRRKKGNREDTSGKLMGEYDTYVAAGYGCDPFVEEYEPFWFRTFRYVRLEIETKEDPLQLVNISYRETGYPLEVKAQFKCSDEELNTIWDLSVRTLKRCMHETYEDCPYYEQLQYAMDSRLMMLFTYYLSADDRMPRRTIEDFYRSRQPSGMLQSRFPSVEPQVIPSFSLYWIDMLAEHYEFSGDIEVIKQYRPAMIELLDWFHHRLTDNGIVGVTSNRYWNYFDWVEAWPLGTPPESMDRPMYLLSLMYAVSLRKASTLFEITGWSDVAAEMEMRADLVCSAVRRLAWSDDRQLFRDLPDTEIYSQHMQILAVLSDTVTGEEAKQLIDRTLQEPIHQVTLPFSFLLFEAIKKTGQHQLGFNLWERWRVFASQGLTTLPETEVNPRSDCHAWSAVPLSEFPTSILGISPVEPGFRTISIAPQVGKLKWAKGSISTIHGLVEVEWELEADIFKLRAKVPNGVTAVVQLPDGTEKIFTGESAFQVCR